MTGSLLPTPNPSFLPAKDPQYFSSIRGSCPFSSSEISLNMWFSNFSMYQNYFEDSLPQDSLSCMHNSIGLGKSSRIFISPKFSDDVAAAVPKDNL